MLTNSVIQIIQASDCIFLGRIRKDFGSNQPPDSGCVRFSRVRHNQELGGMQFTSVTTETPVMYTTNFGDRGCGVLHPATTEVIKHGAEDGGEMGAFHDFYLSLLAEAVVDKLADYMPIGLDAVVIPDERLLSMPD